MFPLCVLLILMYNNFAYFDVNALIVDMDLQSY